MIVHVWKAATRTITPQLVRRVFLPLSCAVFFGSLVVAALFYFSTRHFDLRDCVISDLESPEDNPRGYGFAAIGTAVCGILLIPAAVLFYSRLRVVRRKLAFIGSVLFTAGLAAAIAIGFLAPFTRDYTPVHIQLAFAAFIGICSGTLVCSIVATVRALETDESWGTRLAANVVVQTGVLLFLVYLYFTPHFFTYKGLLTSLAFWEWLLCAHCGASVWLLTAALDAFTTDKPRVMASSLADPGE